MAEGEYDTVIEAHIARVIGAGKISFLRTKGIAVVLKRVIAGIAPHVMWFDMPTAEHIGLIPKGAAKVKDKILEKYLNNRIEGKFKLKVVHQ